MRRRLGGRLAHWSAVPASADTQPNAFSFTDQTNVPLSTTRTSLSVTIAGISAAASFTTTGGTLSVNSGSFVSSGTVNNGDVIRARVTSSGSTSTAVSCVVTIGGVSDTFTATTGDGTQSVLTPADIEYVGQLRITQQLWGGGTGRLDGSSPNGCFRKHGDGTISYFMYGQAYEGYATNMPLVEFLIDPDDDPHPTLSLAPRMAYVRDWGEFRDGHIIAASNEQRNYVSGGMLWDEGRNGIWWTTGDGYVAEHDHPTLSFTHLNDVAHTVTSYGPWRIDMSNLGGGHRRFATNTMIWLPDDFVASHCPGFPMAVLGAMGSGVGNSPFGPNLCAVEDFDPFTLPACTGINQAANVDSLHLIAYDINHKKGRDTRYKTCAWNGNPGVEADKYNCQYGAGIAPGTGAWGGINESTAENDKVDAVCWVNTPARRGLLFLGALARTPSGLTAVGDPDGLIHAWYANYGHATDTEHGNPSGPPYANQACCHMQFDPRWQSTGPGTHFRQPMGWIYDPDDLADTAALTVNPWDLVPTTDGFECKDIAPPCDLPLPTSAASIASDFRWGGVCWVDPDTYLMYVPAAQDFITDDGNRRLPNMLVFQLPS